MCQVHLNGEDVGVPQHGIAVIIVLGHGRHKALELEYDVLDWGRRGADRPSDYDYFLSGKTWSWFGLPAGTLPGPQA